jgi:1-acyl-sn-glycerol-3-phosphate acyltransferase
MRLGYGIVSWLSRTLFRIVYGLKVVGLENIPRTGKLIIASNHRSDYDPPVLGGIVPREMHFFAKEELFRNRWLGGLIRYLNAFPVRRGQFDREALQNCLDVLKSEGSLIFFPEGTRAPSDGFLRAKLGLGWVISLSQAAVIPVYLHGSTVRKPHWRQRPAITVVFGKPVAAAELLTEGLRGKELYQSASDKVLEMIRDLSLSTPGGKVLSKGTLYDRDIISQERLR